MERTNPSVRRPTGGYTLIEMLVVLALIGVLALGVVPSMIQIMSRQQTRGFARTSESFLNFARLRAIRGGRPVHVQLETSLNSQGERRTSLTAAIDIDQDGAIDLLTPGAVDQLINQDQVPGPIQLKAPAGEPVVVGFNVLVGDAFNPELTEIVFNSDGSVARTGAVRYGDPRDNYFELAVGPSRAVGRVVVRKWDGANFWARGDGPTDWQWL